MVTIKKIFIIFIIFFLYSCGKQKGRQIIITPEKEYYTDFYTVYFNPNCIEFYSYENDDSTFVRVCPPWDVKPNK
jgi:hypothetical protein